MDCSLQIRGLTFSMLVSCSQMMVVWRRKWVDYGFICRNVGAALVCLRAGPKSLNSQFISLASCLTLITSQIVLILTKFGRKFASSIGAIQALTLCVKIGQLRLHLITMHSVSLSLEVYSPYALGNPDTGACSSLECVLVYRDVCFFSPYFIM